MTAVIKDIIDSLASEEIDRSLAVLKDSSSKFSSKMEQHTVNFFEEKTFKGARSSLILSSFSTRFPLLTTQVSNTLQINYLQNHYLV